MKYDYIYYTLKELFCVKNTYNNYGCKKSPLSFYSSYTSDVKKLMDLAGANYRGLSTSAPFGCATLGKEIVNNILVGGSSIGAPQDILSGRSNLVICSDTGGSARVPAIRANLFGFKPTYEVISRHGLVPLCNTFDTVGLISNKLNIIYDGLNILATKKCDKKNKSVTFLDCNDVEKNFLKKIIKTRSFEKKMSKKKYEGIGVYYNKICFTDFYSNMCRIFERNIYTKTPFSNSVRSKFLPEEVQARILCGAALLKSNNATVKKINLDNNLIITPAEKNYIHTYDKYDGSYLALANILERPSLTLPIGKRGLQLMGVKHSDLEVLQIASKIWEEYCKSPHLH